MHIELPPSRCSTHLHRLHFLYDTFVPVSQVLGQSYLVVHFFFACTPLWGNGQMADRFRPPPWKALLPRTVRRLVAPYCEPAAPDWRAEFRWVLLFIQNGPMQPLRPLRRCLPCSRCRRVRSYSVLCRSCDQDDRRELGWNPLPAA